MSLDTSGTASSSVRVAFPGYRVFIYGHEVTNDVVAINIESHDGAAPNMCQITLLNRNDRYIVTSKDVARIKKVNNFYLGAIFGSRVESNLNRGIRTLGFNDLGSDSIFKRGVVDTVDDYVMDEIKDRILTSKNIIKPNVDADAAEKTDYLNRKLSGRMAKYFSRDDEELVYPIHDGAPVFHPMDPVRVFMRDPFTPSDWYHGFCGFVSDMTETCDENNTRTLTISVEDPTKLFRYTRIGLNPGIFDKATVQQEDLTVHGLWTNLLTGLSLPQMFYLLMFGSEKVKALPSKEATERIKNQNTQLRGVGHFSYDGSIIATIGDGASTSEQVLTPQNSNWQRVNNDGVVEEETAGKITPQTMLSDVGAGNGVKKKILRISAKDAGAWQALLDHKVYPSDLRVMAKDEDRAKDGVMDARYGAARAIPNDGRQLARELFSVGGDDPYNNYDVNKIIEYIGTHPDEYLVDGGRLMMLIPSGIGTENNNIVDKDIISSPYIKTEWSTVGEIMYETVDRIQFSMYCTPRGDIVVEPPMFDADPSFFGESIRKLDAIRESPLLNAEDILDYMGKEDIVDRRRYCDDYVVFKSDTFGWDSTYSDEKVYTIAVADNAIVQNFTPTARSDIFGQLKVKRLDNLIPLYGVRAAPVAQRGYVSTPEAAYLYASITLDKLNADARTVSIRALPNIKMWINRPIYFEPRNLIGTTKNISHSITWGASGDMSTSLQINTVRTWDGTVADLVKSEKFEYDDKTKYDYYEVSDRITELESKLYDINRSRLFNSGLLFDDSLAGNSYINQTEEYSNIEQEIHSLNDFKSAIEDKSIKTPDPILFTPIGGYGGRMINYQVLWNTAPVPKRNQGQNGSDNDAAIQLKTENKETDAKRVFIHPVANPVIYEAGKHPSLGSRYNYDVNAGADVVSCSDGRVVALADSGNAGYYVQIEYKAKSTGKWLFTYVLLDNISPAIKPGKQIKQGQKIAVVGSQQNDQNVNGTVLFVSLNGVSVEFRDYIK